MTEKPLHVQVAEALGWSDVVHFGYAESVISPAWGGVRPLGTEKPVGISEIDTLHLLRGGPARNTIPRYDTDWGATGPLIGRFGLVVGPNFALNQTINDTRGPWKAGWTGGGYDPIHLEDWNYTRLGETPTVAICNLVLALKEAGKLEPVTA